ncbi:hypothetical protein MD484_g8534, partial [Candolleomyces efflorescens]
MEQTPSTSNKTSNKRPRRCVSSANHGGPMSPADIMSASKRPRIIAKVHTALQAKSDAATDAARRKQLPKEDQAVLEELASASSVRPKAYADLGKGLPANSAKPNSIVPERIPTVSHLIARLEQLYDTDEEVAQDASSKGVTPPDSTASSKSDTPPDSSASLKAEKAAGITVSSDQEAQEAQGRKSKGKAPAVWDEESEEDADWVDEEVSETGSSDKYSVEDESLGYITSEDDSSISSAVDQAVVEATLEGLGVEETDLLAMDRAKKRIILRNSSLRELRRLQRKKKVDDIDIGNVVLDRLDQDLRRIGIKAASLLRLMEVTDTLVSGSFLLPLMERKTCIPNDLDIFASLGSYEMVLSYLRKKGFQDCKRIYPNGRQVGAYSNNLRDISFIYEVKNKRSYKFHSTPVMNYLSFHGLVCLYDITLYKMGIANYCEDVPRRVQACYDKYRDRGFDIWQHLEEDHICKIDGCCPQTVRSLFDKDVVHIRFPDFVETAEEELRKNEARIAMWRLATGAACKGPTHDTAGFAICDWAYSAGRK